MSGDSSNKNSQNASGDQGEAFVQLLMEHEPQVRSFLRGLLPSWSDVDEVVQEASLIAWRKFGQFEQGTAFGGWFLTIARFEALKHRRRIARTPLVFSESVWELLADQAVDDDAIQIRRTHLEKCMRELSASQREVLLKVYSPGAVIRQVAVQSGKGEQAFYKMIQRLRGALLTCISRSISAENA